MPRSQHPERAERSNISRPGRRIRVVDVGKLRSTVTGTAVGNFMEWYDYGIYGFLATTLASVFFPEGSTALLATFTVLAISFGVRPLGGLVFGALADRIGRKQVLTITILMMAVGTTAIGVLPSYSSVGYWAFVLLIVCRVVQGFSTGGEYVDAMVYINEHSPDRRRGFWVSWLPVGTLTGYVAGSGLVTVLTLTLSEDALESWGWRIPFLLAAFVGLVGLYIRLKLDESPVYEEEQQKSDTEDQEKNQLQRTSSQFRETITRNWQALLIVIGLVLVVNVETYTLTSYLPSYLMAIVGVSNTTASVIVLAVLLILAATVTLPARLSDRIGRRPIMFVGCGLLLVASAPAFLLMQADSTALIFVGALIVGIMLLCFTSVEPATLPAMFPTRDRALGVSIGYNTAVTAFGGTTPMILEALYQATGSELMPAYYLMAAGIVGAVAVYLAHEPAGEPMPEARPAAESNQEADRMLRERRDGDDGVSR